MKVRIQEKADKERAKLLDRNKAKLLSKKEQDAKDRAMKVNIQNRRKNNPEQVYLDELRVYMHDMYPILAPRAIPRDRDGFHPENFALGHLA